MFDRVPKVGRPKSSVLMRTRMVSMRFPNYFIKALKRKSRELGMSQPTLIMQALIDKYDDLLEPDVEK